MPKLKDLLEEIDTGDFDIEVTGFDEKEIEKLMTQFHTDEEKKKKKEPDPDQEPEKKQVVCPHCGEQFDVFTIASKQKQKPTPKEALLLN